MVDHRELSFSEKITAPERVMSADAKDDAAVDRFAAAMKTKMARSRAKGRDGWDDPNLCPPEVLLNLLSGHLLKGNENNEIDLACILMMLRERGMNSAQIAEHLRISLGPVLSSFEKP